MQIALCDDDTFFREELKTALLSYKTEKRICFDIYEFNTGKDLLESRENFDIIFLDYQMPYINGLDTAKELRNRNSLCSIIFITNHPEFVFESFVVKPFRFMVKPLDKCKLTEALDAFILQYKSIYPMIITEDGARKVLNARAIIYAEADGKYSIIVTENNVYRSSKTLSQIQALVPGYCFYRIHKSFLINMHYVSEINGNKVMLNNGQMAIIGRNHIKAFNNDFSNFIKNHYVKL